jgi:hypothetical protein
MDGRVEINNEWLVVQKVDKERTKLCVVQGFCEWICIVMHYASWWLKISTRQQVDKEM